MILLHMQCFHGISLIHQFCDKYAVRTSLLRLTLLNQPSLNPILVESLGHNLALTESVLRQEMIPAAAIGAVVLKIETRLAWENFPNAIKLFAWALSAPTTHYALLVCVYTEVMYLSVSFCHSERKLLRVGSGICILAMVFMLLL